MKTEDFGSRVFSDEDFERTRIFEETENFGAEIFLAVNINNFIIRK